MRLLTILILLSALCESACLDDASQTATWTDDNDSIENARTEIFENGENMKPFKLTSRPKLITGLGCQSWTVQQA